MVKRRTNLGWQALFEQYESNSITHALLAKSMD